jgi:hypothetical protein
MPPLLPATYYPLMLITQPQSWPQALYLSLQLIPFMFALPLFFLKVSGQKSHRARLDIPALKWALVS